MAQAASQGYGIKIARAGFNANTCADYDLLFNSAWPSLPIAFSTLQTTTVAAGTTSLPPIPHGLNYIPMVMGWIIQGSKQIGRIFPDVDKTNIYLTYNNPFSYFNTGDTIKFYLVCYAVDISRSASYEYLPPSAVQQPYDKKFGIKVAKLGKSASSTDLRNFILHSRAQSPAILQIIASTDPSTTTLSYTMPAGYTTWVYGWGVYDRSVLGESAVTYVNAPLYPQSTPGITLPTQNNFLLSVGVSKGGSLVILRDPLFAPNTISVVY
jgi:hypothetical protein